MPTAYKGIEYNLDPSPRYVEAGVFSIYSHFALSAVLATSDTITMFKVPAGARIIGLTLSADDLSAAADITLSVGDADTAARFISAAIIGQAGGTINMIDATYGVRAGFAYQYTADTAILITVAAGGTTTTTGTIKLVATLAVDN
jgi:hypothetical protein